MAVIERNPSGTRDYLPDEMRELRALTARLLAVFDSAGYGEVYTPALEYERAFQAASTPPAYRMFDQQGSVLVLRSDMTVPIARVAATRYASAEPPLRFCYLAHVYRGVRPQRGHSREFLQAGVELIGAPAPHGTAEVLRVLCDALEAAGLEGYAIGVGDASLIPNLLESLGVAPAAAEEILAALVRGDFVEFDRKIANLGLGEGETELLQRLPRLRGGSEILADETPALQGALAGMRELSDLLGPREAERIIFDLGLVRSLGYYTGAVFQVYDPASGVPIGSGGRYDDLLATFGPSLPAVGFALNVERLHIALTGEERAAAQSAPRDRSVPSGPREAGP